LGNGSCRHVPRLTELAGWVTGLAQSRILPPVADVRVLAGVGMGLEHPDIPSDLEARLGTNGESGSPRGGGGVGRSLCLSYLYMPPASEIR
jgi:hypothetical protein